MTVLSVRRRVLVVGRGSRLQSLAVALAAEGYESRIEADATTTGQAVAAFEPDVLVVHLRAGADPDGLALARRMRDVHDLPLVCVTGDRDGAAVLAAFDAGADDVVSSDVDLDELLARLRAVLRRSGRGPAQRWAVGDLVVDEPAHTVERAGEAVELTRTEFEILLALVRQRGRVVPKHVLLTTVWGSDVYDANLVEVHVSQLRRKLEAGGGRRLVHTVRNVGYVCRDISQSTNGTGPIS